MDHDNNLRRTYCPGARPGGIVEVHELLSNGYLRIDLMSRGHPLTYLKSISQLPIVE